jgi:hypothetical protein
MTGDRVLTPPSVRHALRTIVRLPLDYRVSLLVLLLPAVATALARWRLGDAPTAEEIDRLGYGWPAFEAGRWWTPVTGAVVLRSLEISFIPSYTFVAVVLLEHRARHWRTAVAVFGGQVLGVVLALLLVIPLKGRSGAFATEMTRTVDFGISVGGFACLGMWSCYLSPSWRRPLRWAVTFYLLGQLLLSGLIFDVSHPIGWALGVFGGAWLMKPAEMDRSPMRLPADAWWTALGVVVGAVVGIVAGWNSGGIGGIFGWGP